MDDRELDTQIAEKIMGFLVYNKESVEALLGLDGCWTDKKTGKKVIWSGDLKYYSTDIKAAWEVVEKLKDGGSPTYNGFTLDYDSFHKIWRADFGPFASADTAPLAICRAALKSIE